MTRNTTGSFFARLRQMLFQWRIEREIFERIMPHLQREGDHGYPFGTDEEMNVQTDELDVQCLLDTIEQHICNMPKAYGESFRHIMHRDLHEDFLMYEQVARRQIRRSCDSRLIAKRLEA
jgi:hypothetical protein